MKEELIETTDAIAAIEVVDAEVVSRCVPGEACKVADFFEMITTCDLCGKLF